MKWSRWTIGIMAASACLLGGVQVATATGSELIELPCETQVIGELSYLSGPVEGDDSLAEARDEILNTGLVEGSTSDREVRVGVDQEGERIVAIETPDGELETLVQMEGSDFQGWRAAQILACAS
jgi:hypothetical protein